MTDIVLNINGVDTILSAQEAAALDVERAAIIQTPQGLVTTVSAVDFWSRMTDAEADQVAAAMATQTVRIQNIFRAAGRYQSDHELWPVLTATAQTLFGAGRAGEILAPSI